MNGDKTPFSVRNGGLTVFRFDVIGSGLSRFFEFFK